MMAQQKFHGKLFFEEKTSDQQQSILLVDIMNALGFSKREREIHIHHEHLRTLVLNIFRKTDKKKVVRTGSISEGMCGGVYHNQNHHDIDCLSISKHIKLYPPRANNINNPLPLPPHANEDYDASCFVEEDNNFPGYVKLSLAEVKTNSVYLDHCRIMNDGKLYLSNSVIIDPCCEQFIKSSKDHCIDFPSNHILSGYQKGDRVGPAHTVYYKCCTGTTTKTDIVECIHYDIWPNSANSFITRRKPHNWPCNSIIRNIQSQGCYVAPVGHHDSKNNDMQWRISFPGEQSLLLDLTDVQILCYALIKIILRENLNTSQREVVSSFHIKQVIFWCVELSSCQWVYSNYIKCLNICLTKLIEKIKARHIPHYIIESRNLFNSKMTEKMSKEIVHVLSKYDTTYVFTLDAFEIVLKLTHYNNALLKREVLISTIMACFNTYFGTFVFYVTCPSSFWDSYIPHNATLSLLNCVNILQNLNKVKGVSIQYAKYLVRSMVGFLYFVKYKESNKTDFLLASKRLIHKSVDLDTSCVKLRSATFFLITQEYNQSIELCDTFLTFPPRHKVGYSYSEYFSAIRMKVAKQLCEREKTEEIENIMNTILLMFYSSVKLKSWPENCDIAEQSPVWKFRNFTNIVFHDVYMDVTFMTAAKWAVPDPIQYELLSLSKGADYNTFSFSGIHLDPMFICLQTKFLYYHWIGNVNGTAEIFTLMNSFIRENTFTTKRSCAYLNMLTYCQIKAGHHRQSIESILQSLRIFPSRYNTASGYLKIILQILNSLFMYNC